MEEESRESPKRFADDTLEKMKQINEYHETVLVSTDQRISSKDEIEKLKAEVIRLKGEQEKMIAELNEYHKMVFDGSDTEDSIEDSLLGFIENSDTKLKELEKKQQQFEAFYTLVFDGTGGEASYQSQFKNSVTQITKELTETEDQLRELKAFHGKIVDSTKDGKKVAGLDTQVQNLKTQLQTLIADANSKLHALTDSALHNAFAIRAENYTKEFKTLQNYTFYCVAALIIDLLAFGLAQIILIYNGNPFNYHILIYQFSVAGALIFAIWMFNRNQKIAKKLAEEYHHKASIAEAMTGYRSLYALDHDDEEYLALFNSIKDQLNINPSKQIDTFLNLKSPHEELSGAVSDLLSPKTLEALANQLKPFLDKAK